MYKPNSDLRNHGAESRTFSEPPVSDTKSSVIEDDDEGRNREYVTGHNGGQGSAQSQSRSRYNGGNVSAYGMIVHGNVNMKSNDCVNIVSSNGQENVVGMVVGEDATVNIEKRGGIDIVGGSPDFDLHDMKSSKRGYASNSGNVIGMRITKGGVATFKHEGGIEMVGGVSNDLLQYSMKTVGDKKLKVSVKYSDYSGRFEGSFKRNRTVFDVIVEILKEKRDKRFRHIESKDGKKLHEDTELSTLEEAGLLKNMTAVFE